MQNDFLITLAWPEGMVAAPNSWYDKIASKNGKYRAGHSAIVLINTATQKAHYFDFGRYHAPEYYGRVRDAETDPGLNVIDAKIEDGEVQNIHELLLHLAKMKATYGEGRLYASLLKNIDFDCAFTTAKNIQKKGLILYGPFVKSGTNCSRFVATVLKNSGISFIKKLRLKYPFCISPSPKRNVSITNHHYYVVENQKCIEVKKSKLQAYFSSIEI